MIILLAELIGNAVTDKYQMLAVRLDRRIVIEHFLARKKSRMRIAAAGYSFPYRSRNGSIVSLCKLRKRERNICLPIENNNADLDHHTAFHHLFLQVGKKR